SSKSTRPMSLRSPFTGGSASARSVTAPIITGRPNMARPARLSCAAIFASQRFGAGPSRMIGKIRIFLALSLVVVGSLALVPLQLLSMKTGIWRETVILKVWHRLIVRTLGLRIHVKGALSIKRPLLVASNHISWTDIMVLGSFADVTFIARADMEGWPLIGWLSKLQRTGSLERDRQRTAGD